MSAAVSSSPVVTSSASSNNAPSASSSNGASSGGGGSGSGNGSSGASASSKQDTYLSLWDMNGQQVDEWVRSVPTLFPQFKTPDKAPSSSSSSTQKGEGNDTTPPAKLTAEQAKRLALADKAWKNLLVSLEGLKVQVEKLPSPAEHDGEDEDSKARPTKRMKSNSGKPKSRNMKKKKKKLTKTTIQDPFDIFVHAIRRDENDEDDGDDPNAEQEDDEEYASDIKPTIGGKLSQLSSSGLINGMAGRLGGVVVDRYGTPQTDFIVATTAIPTVENATIQDLKSLASAFGQAIQTRMETDVLITTPIRIQQMLAPEILSHEFKAIRRRIYDTVILGKGMGHGALDDGSDIPTAPSTGVHDLEKFKKCKSCGNNDQSLFVLDRKNGDVICSNCGTVASESLMHEGSQYRKFEGEVDRNHHGDTQNPLYSNAHNMGTTLGGIQMTPGAGGAGAGGFGTGKRGLETILRNAHAYTELNISQFGKGDRRTRTGYKDKQKKDAFIQMTHCGDALNLHEAVVHRAKELFAGFRDDRELVQQFKGVIAACLCEAFEQLSSDGRQILKQKLEHDNAATTDEAAKSEKEAAAAHKFTNNKRANKRNNMHHANLAGKGGLLLDFTAAPQKDKLVGDGMKNKGSETPGAASAPATASSPSAAAGVSEKPASKWDLDDCRSWLLEASRSIAKQWIHEQKNNPAASTSIPKGATQEELEGRLVEHAITLCDLLEAELKEEESAAAKKGGKLGMGGPRSGVVTPRVKNMAALGIKWQHSHERGSGGKGGVGNSGKGRVPGGAATAGQILIMKTSKTLTQMLKDKVAGEAIHKELRALVGQQAAIKRKEQRDEATRQRLVQMKRKPWLQARAQM